MPTYRSIDAAWLAFNEYAAIEPRLLPLWELCRSAAPPAREPDVLEDDPFELEALAADKPDDSWCAEDYFYDEVKSKLLLLIGLHRPGPQHALHEPEAFDEVYDLLLNWALHRPCSCCAAPNGEQPHDHESPAPR